MISLKTFEKLFPQSGAAWLTPSSTTLTAYGGSTVQYYGTCKVTIKQKYIEEMSQFHDIDVGSPALLGLPTCGALKFGSTRVCVSVCDHAKWLHPFVSGWKDLNKAIKWPHHVTPTLDDILPQLNGANFFSIMDAGSGYWNIKLNEESSYLTTFNTPHGHRWCYLVTIIITHTHTHYHSI